MTTLHSGGKFEGKAYSTSGGLHGVGVSVVNALSSETIVEVARDKILYRQTFAQGPRHLEAGRSRRRPQPPRHHRRLHPRPRDFRRRRPLRPRPPPQARPLQGLSVRRGRDPLALRSRRSPATTSPKPPSSSSPAASPTISPSSSATRNASPTSRSPASQDFPASNGDSQGSAEWAVAWPLYGPTAAESYYCNTIPTPDGGTHEAGLRAALTKGMRAFGELVGNKRAKDITADDVFDGVELMLSDLHPQPPFPEPDQGPPDQPRGGALRRGRGARPFRPLSRRQYGPRPRASGRDRRADGGAPEAPRRARGQAQDRHLRPQAPPPRQAHRLRQ